MSRKKPLFKKMTIIGIGHIGASIALGARKNHLAGKIIAGDSRKTHLKIALKKKIIDQGTSDLGKAVKDADLVILAVPVASMGKVARRIGKYLKPNAILTDVGSVKKAVIEDIAPHLPPHVLFVPAHPIAGTEHSGPESGLRELFKGRWCILTPDKSSMENLLREREREENFQKFIKFSEHFKSSNKDTHHKDGYRIYKSTIHKFEKEQIQKYEAAVRAVEQFWTKLGAKVTKMNAVHHDRVLAITSHLPHLIAYTIVSTADDLAEDLKSEVIQYSASGFRDFTRIAASNPVMWRDIFLNNKEAVFEIAQRFSEDLTALQKAIRRGKGEHLIDLFTRSRAIRKQVLEQKQDSDTLKKRRV